MEDFAENQKAVYRAIVEHTKLSPNEAAAILMAWEHVANGEMPRGFGVYFYELLKTALV